MSDKILALRLEVLQEACVTAVRQIDADVDVCQQECGTIGREIQALQQRLEHMQQHEHKLRQMRVSQMEQCADEQRDITVATLRASFACFVHGHDYWTKRAHLEHRIQSFWSEDPLLESKIKTYHQVKANAEAYLQGLPELVRDAMAQTLHAEQEKIYAQIAPFLALQTELGALQPEQPFTLQIAVVANPEDALISWILPFPADEKELPAHAAPVLNEVADEIIRAIGSLSKHTGWNIEDIDIAGWEGCMVLLTLATYDGKEALAAAAQQLLIDRLRATPLFQHVELHISIDQLSHAAWQRGRPNVARVDAEPADELDDALGDGEAEQSLGETSQGWYTHDDLKVWERKKESKFTPQARRLRTLLVRMIGRGMVGGSAAPIDILCETLPPKHAAEMRRGIDSLVHVGLLHTIESAHAADGVTINPDMLAEVQSLITREPTAFWEPFIG